MKRLCYSALLAVVFATFPGFRGAAMSDAQVQVNIDLPLPHLAIPAPPPLLPIPGAYVYYPPDVNVDIFFHHDRWYRPYSGRWYRAKHYNGPWHVVHEKHIPRAVIGIPASFRSAAYHGQRVPYDQVRRNHWKWEKHRHWDRDRHDTHNRFRGETHRNNYHPSGGHDRNGHSAGLHRNENHNRYPGHQNHTPGNAPNGGHRKNDQHGPDRHR